MAAKNLITVESDNSLSFGDYTLPQKSKVEDFPYDGNLMKVKTFNEITKLEKNGMFVYESV
ncbi:MAG: endosialidase, partial [Lachnospiraceae bacterium]|nr:endosialidase [Lachnospiraceae bacterium]